MVDFLKHSFFTVGFRPGKFNVMAVFAMALVLLPACKKEDNSPAAGEKKVLISRTDSDNGLFTVSLLADDTLFAGYNRLYFDVTDKSSGDRPDIADIVLYPRMHMVSMIHAAPVENPDNNSDSNGYFEGAVTFVMPDNPDEHWSLGATVSSGGKTDSLSFSIPVVRSLSESRIVNVISPLNGKTYFFALLQPASPGVGMNDLEFGAWYRQDMMHFPAANDLTLSFVPEMPSMGHSSPNNVNPVYQGDGHYTGKVNFTMTGWWRINLTVEQNTQMLSDSLSFNITF
jgi:hypothetical protein